MLKKNKQVKSDKVASEMFDIIVEFLDRHSNLDTVDSVIVNITALNYSTYLEYAEFVRDGNMTQSSENGYRSLSPEYSIYRNAMNDLEGNIKQLGLSPWARNNLKGLFEKRKVAKKKLDDKFFKNDKKDKRPNAEA